MKYREALTEWRRAFMQQALDRCDGNVSKAAKLIGVSAELFYKRKLCWQSAHSRGNTEFRALQ